MSRCIHLLSLTQAEIFFCDSGNELTEGVAA